jgi:hypothetical protein
MPTSVECGRIDHTDSLKQIVGAVKGGEEQLVVVPSWLSLVSGALPLKVSILSDCRLLTAAERWLLSSLTVVSSSWTEVYAMASVSSCADKLVMTSSMEGGGLGLEPVMEERGG